MVISKAGSEVILKCLMGKQKEIDVEGLPWGPEDERVPAGIETVVEASVIKPAKGVRVDEVMIKREGGASQRLVLGTIGNDDNSATEIKEEPDG